MNISVPIDSKIEIHSEIETMTDLALLGLRKNYCLIIINKFVIL